MALFIMTTKLSAVHTVPRQDYKSIAKDLDARAKAACPGLEWKGHFAVLGPFDYLDIFEAPDMEAAMEIAGALREAAPAEFRIWPARHWKDYASFIEDSA